MSPLGQGLPSRHESLRRHVLPQAQMQAAQNQAPLQRHTSLRESGSQTSHVVAPVQPFSTHQGPVHDQPPVTHSSPHAPGFQRQGSLRGPKPPRQSQPAPHHLPPSAPHGRPQTPPESPQAQGQMPQVSPLNLGNPHKDRCLLASRNICKGKCPTARRLLIRGCRLKGKCFRRKDTPRKAKPNLMVNCPPSADTSKSATPSWAGSSGTDASTGAYTSSWTDGSDAYFSSRASYPSPTTLWSASCPILFSRTGSPFAWSDNIKTGSFYVTRRPGIRFFAQSSTRQSWISAIKGSAWREFASARARSLPQGER
uniref:Uncharacterized protein n=1 Tax=Bionectria ochroleuca TaxID=29856 RepID=A0A8H7KB93_BIOOC